MIKRWTTTNDFITYGKTAPTNTVIETEGMTSVGDGGALKLYRTGNTGTPSQDFVTRGNNTCTDASGTEWGIIEGTLVTYNGTTDWFNNGFGSIGVGNYILTDSTWIKATVDTDLTTIESDINTINSSITSIESDVTDINNTLLSKADYADLTKAQEELLSAGSKVYPDDGSVLANGDNITAGTTHLRVLVGGEPTIVAMSPVASGVVSLLTETSATIGITSVNFSINKEIEFSDVASLKSPPIPESLVALFDVPAKTTAYYGGWAVQTAPIGGANYILTTLQKVRDTLADPTWEPDGYGDHYLFGGTTYVAKLNEKDVFIEMYGASELNSNNSPNIQACWDSNLVSHAKEGTFDFSDRLIIPGGYGWTFEGSGAGTELNWTSSSTTEWAVSGLQSDGITYSNLYRHVLKDFAIKGTITVSLLLDITRFKYSSMINVGIYNAAACMQLRSAWSNKFEDCRFYPYAGHPSKTSHGVGVVLGSYNEDQSLLPDANEVNSVNFSSCVIEGAASAFLVNSYLNNVSVDNSCNIDGCGCVVRAKSDTINFAIRGMTIRDSYLEWCLDAPLIIDIGAGQSCGVSVSFIDNYIQPTDVGVATLMNVISTGISVFGKVEFKRNKEVHRSTNAPSSGYALYTPVGTSDLYINYFNEHDSSIIGVVPPQAYDPNTIDLRRLSTNIPFKPEVITYGDGEYGPISTSDPLTITPYMGTMRVRGTVKHSGTATAANRPVANFPTTARQSSYEVFALCALRNGSGVVSQGYVKLINDVLWIYGIADNGATIDFSYRTNTPQDFDSWPNV